MKGPGENITSDLGQGSSQDKPGSNAQTAMDINRQKQLFFDQIAETEYGKQRLRIFHELAFLNQTHKKGKFTNSDQAIEGITAWLATNPYAEAGDLLDILNKWLRHAKKDETSWTSDSKIFTDKLEAILWRAIVAFIRQLDRKELNTSLKAGPGSEAERLMHIARIQELEASEKQWRDSERQMGTTLHEQTTLSSVQKQKLETNEQDIARLTGELASTKEALAKAAATAATLEAEKARSTAEKEANEQIIAKLREDLASTKEDLKMVSTEASQLQADKARNAAEKDALAKENADLKERTRMLEEKLRNQEGTIAQVSNTILERINEVAEQSRKINESLLDRNLSVIVGGHDDSRSSSAHNHAFAAPLPKKVIDCITYIKSKQCITPARLNAIIGLGQFLSTFSSAAMSDFAVEGVIKLTSGTPGSLTPEYLIKGMLEQILRLEKALDVLKSELQRACESLPTSNVKEDLTKRELSKALFNLFKADAFNVKALYDHYDRILTETRPIANSVEGSEIPHQGNRSRSNSEDRTDATKVAVSAEPPLPNGGFFQPKF